MKNRLILAVFAVILTIFAISSITVSAQTNGGDDVVATPSTSGTGTTETSNSNGNDDVVSTPASNAPASNTGSGTLVSNGDDDVVSTPSTPTTPTTPTDSSSRGGRSGSSRTVANSTSSPAVLGASTFACPLITTSMKLGWKNDSAEVAKLQAFLKNVEKLDVVVSGDFDEKTDAAVKAFQAKYLVTTMGPWDATRPSGFVYITTGKQINKIACATPLTLSAEELAIIEAYKARPQVEVTGADTIGNSSGTLNGEVSSSTDDIGSDESSNVAGAGSASILGKFWNFIKNLFK